MDNLKGWRAKDRQEWEDTARGLLTHVLASLQHGLEIDADAIKDFLYQNPKGENDEDC